MTSTSNRMPMLQTRATRYVNQKRIRTESNYRGAHIAVLLMQDISSDCIHEKMSAEDKEAAKKPPGATAEKPSAQMDGKDAFLSQLRSADGAFANDDTIGAKNTSSENHRRDVSSLSDLFEKDLSNSPGAPLPSTKVLPPRPPALHKRNRSVSWGNNNIQQPHLNDEVPRSPGEQARYTIDDLLSAGPYEQEAETNILRALEEKQHSVRARADTGSSTILSGVPDSISHDFTLSPSVDHSHEEPSSERSTEQEMLSSSSTRRREGLLKQESKSLLNNRARKSHRRVMSVEEKLAGLTSAMSALDHNPVVSIPQEESVPASSAGQFAQNAALLARHEGEEDQQHQTPRDRWIHLPTLQETEGQSDTGKDEDSSSDEEDDVETGIPTTTENDPRPKKHKHKKGSDAIQKSMNAANDMLKDDWETWTTFFQPRREQVWSYVKLVLLYMMIPLTGIACILFYAVGNPPTGVSEDGSTGDKASASWWLLFVVRQVITLSLALLIQLVIIDFIAINTRLMLRLIGPILTLLVVQSKGYPFVFFWWGVFDFSMLYGTGAFAKHWLFWQDAIGLFNEQNPSGHVVDSIWNMRVLTIAISVSAAVAVKRFLVGLYLARQTYAHYGQKLALVLQKMLLVSEVGSLAKEIEKSAKSKSVSFPTDLNFDLSTEGDEEESTAGTGLSRRGSVAADIGAEPVIDMNNRDPLTGSLDRSEKLKIMQLLERWEEPDRFYHHGRDEAATISAVLRFRNALAMMQKQYPFSYAFGPAYSRESCLDSAQNVYIRLLMKTPDEIVLHFNTIALLALRKDGTIDQQKAKDLVKLFRPNRQGTLTMLDFLKSTDSVYKEYRLLQASIENSSRIDNSLEKIINFVFYIVVITIILAALGLNPLALFLSLSSIVLAFAFMISTASSKFFEGMLFILVRRPYNIGDLINVSNVEVQTSFDGAPGWIVENVTLFQTECTWAPTNERASLSNGSLASSRIINWARSPHAQFHIFLNFPINTPYDKILIFKSAVEEYMKARPREWLALNGFRANRIFPEKGYVEYLIVIMHRDGWQMIGQVLDSKANLSSYCMEVTKQLGLTYRAPPLPVDLTYAKASTDFQKDSVTEEVDGESRLQDFRSIAPKFNIKLG